jgi:hypothetical protein
MAKGTYKFYRKKNDVKFIDIQTGEVKCTWNQCFKKFTIKTSVDAEKSYVIDERIKKVEWTRYRTECEECGRQVQCSADVYKSIDSWYHEAFSNPNKKY